jgi:hypothetical protein
MGQESIVMSTPRPKEKSSEIIESSPLYDAMNKLMYKFNELEERIYSAPVDTLPHDAYTSGSARLLVNLPMWEAISPSL